MKVKQLQVLNHWSDGQVLVLKSLGLGISSRVTFAELKPDLEESSA